MTSEERPSPPRDLAISDLDAAELRLGITCLSCGRFRYMKPARFPAGARIHELDALLRCVRCLSADVRVDAVARHPASGYWPAERG